MGDRVTTPPDPSPDPERPDFPPRGPAPLDAGGGVGAAGLAGDAGGAVGDAGGGVGPARSGGDAGDSVGDGGGLAGVAGDEMELPYWLTSTDEAANTTTRQMLGRMPGLLRAAWRLAWQASRRTTIAVVLLELAAGAAGAAGLISVVGILDGLLRDGPTPERVRAAAPSLVLLVGAAAVRGALTSAAAAANARLAPLVYEAAEMTLLDLTTTVDLATFDDPHWRDAMERARDRGRNAAQQLVNQAIELAAGLIALAAAASVLTVLHPVLLPMLVLCVLPIGWAAMRAARLGHRQMLRYIAVWRRERMLTELLAAREPAAELRAFTLRGYLLAEARRLVRIATEEEIRVAVRQVRTALGGTVLSAAATAATYGVLFWLLWTGRMALAAGGAAVYAIGTGIGRLRDIALTANRVFEQGLYFADFQGFCDLSRQRAETPSEHVAPRRFEEIRLTGVTFRYPDAERPAVADVTLTLRRGQVVALVGENGSGKSTLAALLAGLYRPSAGAVQWDGVDTSRFTPESIRERVAVVMQEPTRWPLSARENISIGRHDRPVRHPAVQDAAEAGDAHEFVMELTRQYDTLLSRHFTDGADLSGGQWQRLAVSRAFYRDAALLICDEPTANLDARAEHAVYRRLRELAAGRTVVLITHRMASVREADRIFVLDHGRVAQEGDHETLMRSDGIYRQLFTLQASAYRSA